MCSARISVRGVGIRPTENVKQRQILRSMFASYAPAASLVSPPEGGLSEHRQAGQDESELWRDLDQRFRGALFAYFIRRVRDPAEAEDLTQEVFTRLTRYDNSALGKDVKAFVFVVAGNLLKDRARSKVRKLAGAHRSLDAAPEKFVGDTALVEDRAPERVLMAKESLREFVSALDGPSERT